MWGELETIKAFFTDDEIIEVFNKPCPFCGGIAEIRVDSCCGHSDPSFIIKCKCGVKFDSERGLVETWCNRND